MALDSQKDALREGKGGTRPKLKTDRKILEELTNVTAHKGLMITLPTLPSKLKLSDMEKAEIGQRWKKLNNSKRTKNEEEL